MGVKGLIGKFKHKKEKKTTKQTHTILFFGAMHVSQSIHRAALYSAACGKSNRRNYPLVNTQAIFYISTALFQRLFRRQGSLRSSVNSKNISLKNPIHTSNCLVFFLHLYEKGCQHLSFKIYSVYSRLLSVCKS